MVDDLSVAYVAGFFDGEGNVLISKVHVGRNNPSYHLRVNIGCTDYEPIKYIMDFAKCGAVDTYLTKGNRIYYRWRCSCRNAYTFLQRIYPYLHGRKAQVEIAIQFQQCRNRIIEFGGRKNSISEYALQQYELYYEKIRELKNITKLDSEHANFPEIKEPDKQLKIKGILKY